MPVDSLGRLPQAVECLLFAAHEPLTLARMAEVLDQDEADVGGALESLIQGGGDRGVQIRAVAGGYQMVTHDDFGQYVSRLLSAPPSRLSRAALETLSIVAYRQPVTLPEIESLRGVNASGVVRTLVDRGLIREDGRRETAGRPALYITTEQFLIYFGLKELASLPDLDSLHPDDLTEIQAVTDREEEIATEAA